MWLWPLLWHLPESDQDWLSHGVFQNPERTFCWLVPKLVTIVGMSGEVGILMAGEIGGPGAAVLTPFEIPG